MSALSQTTPDTPRRIVVVEAGISDPSSTKMLADRIVDRVRAQDSSVDVTTVRLAPLALGVASALTSGFSTGSLAETVTQVSVADGVVIATPVYKAGMSGIVKSFLDILDDDALRGTPVMLAATAGTVRHSLVIDQQIRPVLSYLRAYLTPTAVFQAPDDWADKELPGRIDRAARELLDLIEFRRRSPRSASTVDAARGLGHKYPIDFASDLMRLAAGGSSR